jgi:hypothetical protein
MAEPARSPDQRILERFPSPLLNDPDALLTEPISQHDDGGSVGDENFAGFGGAARGRWS